MRSPTFAVLVVLATALLSTASAASPVPSLSNRLQPVDKAAYVGDNRTDAREGGETMADAVPILALPFSDTGATCDNVNDAGLNCADGAQSPDVFYVFTPSVDLWVDVSLCGSGYDTALGVYENGQEIACNDDACGVQSLIANITLRAGRTYHFQVDGYAGSSCGSYTLGIAEHAPCVLECPPGALQEGEPPCHEGYVDEYNGGCNSTGFPTICPQNDASAAILCGKSGSWYDENYELIRDTDWFTCWGTGGTMTMACEAEFPVTLALVYHTDCAAIEYDLISVDACETVMLSRVVPAGTYIWAFVAPSQFSAVPCEADYILTLDGIAAGPECAPTLTRPASWGSIKSTYWQR